MMPSDRQIFRHHSHQPVICVRPTEAAMATRLDGSAHDLARAAALSASIGIPVDAAIVLSFEALTAVPTGDLRKSLVRVTEVHKTGTPEYLRVWVSQLRHGCGWYEDELPRILCPHRLIEAIETRSRSAIQLAGNRQYLPLLLAAEIAAAECGRRLGDALAELKTVFAN